MATEYTIFGNSKPSGLGEHWDPHTFSPDEYPLNRVRATEDGWELLGVRFYILVNQTLPDLYFVAFTTPSGAPDRQSDTVQNPSGEGWVEARFAEPLPMPKDTYIYVGIGSQGASGTWSAEGGTSVAAGPLEITRTGAYVVVNGSGQEIGDIYLGYDIIAAQAETPTGTATGAVTWVTSASGSIRATGAASGTVAWTGSAYGESPPVPATTGIAIGTLDWSHTATGTVAPTGAATGTLAWDGKAKGNSELTRDIWLITSPVSTDWQTMPAVGNQVAARPVKQGDHWQTERIDVGWSIGTLTGNPTTAAETRESDWSADPLPDPDDRWHAGRVYIQPQDKEPSYG